MTPYKEYRAVGIDVENGGESREEGRWWENKNAARAAAEVMRREKIAYDWVIIERRKITVKQVSP